VLRALDGATVDGPLNAYELQRPRRARRSADGIVTADEQGLIESFNRSARRLFGPSANRTSASTCQGYT
jgi:PAS domain-containing protein